MEAKALLLLLFLTLFQIHKVRSQKKCSGFAFSRKIDRRLPCGIFKTLVADHLECQKTCASTAHCFAINVCQKESGSKICELIRKTEDAEEQKTCLLRSFNCEYNEIMEQYDCAEKTRECRPKQDVKIDGWHKRGYVSFKLFRDQRTWHEAVKACKDIRAVIAKIKNKAENDFVSKIVSWGIRSPARHLPVSLRTRVLGHWKLDGRDRNLKLFGESKFQKDIDGVTKVLNLPGSNWSFAETPSFNLNETSFTISVWVRSAVENALIYGRMGSQDYFALGITNKTFTLVFKNEVKEEIRFGFRIPAFLNRWVHYSAALDRTKSKVIFYINGKKLYTKQDPWLKTSLTAIPTPTKMDIGVVRSEDINGYYAMKGNISHLYLFNKALDDEEVALVRDSFYMGNSAWIGLNDIATEGRYMIDDSQVASYTNLAPGQIQEDVQDCVSMRAWDEGKMDVNHCNYTVLPYICMKRV